MIMDDNVFQFIDTNSARGEFESLNRKFAEQKIAIIGLGGTGSYILDLVSKTPVKEIHLYDADVLQLHNLFRAPGTIITDRLNSENELPKVQYYYEVYSRMHKGISPHNEFITRENINRLKGFDYVFICVDKNSVRTFLIESLLKFGITFIDTGLGVTKLDDSLIGTIRITTGNSEMSKHIGNRVGPDEGEENIYATNIQIAELNSLNAALAVLKWKKLCGFYQDLKMEHNTFYFINTNKMINEDFKT